MSAAKWRTHTLCTQAATNISNLNSHAVLQNQIVLPYDCPGSSYAGNRSPRRGGAKSQLPVDVLPGAKIGQHIPAYLQPQTAESVRNSKTISTLQSFPCTRVPAGSGLDGETGFEPSILPRAHFSTTSQIPEAQLSSRSTSTATPADDVFALWPFISTQDLRYNYQLGSRIPEESWHQVRGLFGRLPAREPVQRTAAERRSVHSKNHANSRLDSELRQVCPSSDTMPRVSRHNLGHKTQRKVPVGAEVPIATQSTSRTARERQVVPQTISDLNGETQLCNICDQSGAAPLSNTAILQSTVAEELPISPSKYPPTSSFGDGMVGQDLGRVYAYTHEPHNSPTDYGCIRHRMGCSTGRHQHQRDLDSTTENLACQPKGDVCCSCCGPTSSSSFAKCTGASPDRQPHCGVLYKQRRRNKVKEIASTNARPDPNSRQFECTHSSSIFSRQVQCRGGRSVTPESPTRVASDTSSGNENLPNVGHTGNRPVRFEDSSRGSEVCFHGCQRPASTTPQRILSSVALQTSVAVSTTESYPQSPGPLESSQRSIHPDRSEMEQSVLATRRSTSSPTTPLADSRSGHSSCRHEDRNSPSSSSGPAVGGMADFGWQDMLTEWTAQEKALLMSSWRGSTINTYRPVWRRWRSWCETNLINFKYPNADQVARYLAHLHCNVGLAYRTILVHKSVISTFTHLQSSSIDLSSNFFVKHMIKAISVAREKPAKPPIWNPKVLLHYLSSYNFDVNNLYQVSRHTATLLLLASGRRVHDLTLLRVNGNNLIEENSSIILWPIFGSKTDNCNHRQSGWRLKEHPVLKLNAVYWIKRLLKLSQDRRHHFGNLFMAARGEVKPASRTIIGGWIKSLLKESGIEATPGSVRSAVASLNFVENFSIDQILATGNWKMIHTFKKFYQKELIDYNSLNSTESVSLSNYFDAVR